MAEPVIVAGSAACLHDDLARAWEMYPDADVIAVNDASRHVKAFALVSQHPERFEELGWIRRQRYKFGDGFQTHSNKPPADVVWDLPNCGGSGWLARRIAGRLGYDPVILCGMPMEPGHYVGFELHGLMHRPDVVDELFRQIEADVENHAGCVSMSGRTAALLSP